MSSEAPTAETPKIPVYVMFGKPAVGKGTQGAFLSQMLGLPIVSTGDLLRAAREKGELSTQEIAILDGKHEPKSGEQKRTMLPDEKVQHFLEEELKKDLYKNGVILDGFPRTPKQKELLNSWMTENNAEFKHLVHLDITNEEAQARSAQRCAERAAAGKPPRKDDEPEKVLGRLTDYTNNTLPTIQSFAPNQVVTVDAMGPMEQTCERMLQGLLEKDPRLGERFIAEAQRLSVLTGALDHVEIQPGKTVGDVLWHAARGSRVDHIRNSPELL